MQSHFYRIAFLLEPRFMLLMDQVLLRRASRMLLLSQMLLGLLMRR